MRKVALHGFGLLLPQRDKAECDRHKATLHLNVMNFADAICLRVKIDNGADVTFNQVGLRCANRYRPQNQECKQNAHEV